MQDNVKVKKRSLLRKVATIVFLPILILVWMTGWILIQSGDPGKQVAIKQKTKHSSPKLNSYFNEPQEQEEDTTNLNEQQIVA